MMIDVFPIVVTESSNLYRNDWFWICFGFLRYVIVRAQAYVKRFPRTDRIPVMADSEIIEEEKSEDGLVIRTKRRCKIVVEAPYILKRVSLSSWVSFL